MHREQGVNERRRSTGPVGRAPYLGRRLWAVGAIMALVLAACGSDDGAGAGSTGDALDGLVAAVDGDPAVEPIPLAEPPVRQFCSAGVHLAEASGLGVEQFMVSRDELDRVFADLFASQQTMLGWAPDELEADLHAIGDGIFDVKKVFFDHDYDAAAVAAEASPDELAVLQGFSDGELGARIYRVVATWDAACDGDQPIDLVAAPESGTGVAGVATTVTTTVSTSVATTAGGSSGAVPPKTVPPGGTSTTTSSGGSSGGSAGSGPAFCTQDAQLLSAMGEVVVLGRGTDRFAFGDAHGRFYEMRVEWRPDTPDLFDATFTIREMLGELGTVFPTTGDLGAVADAFQAVWSDPAWLAARAEVDAWLATNCGGSTGGGTTGGGQEDPNGLTDEQALSAALAESILRGQDDLSDLVDTVAGARCIAEGALADIGVDRYDGAYGVNVRSLEENLTMLGVVYDLIDADAVAAAIADCIDLEQQLRRVMGGNEIDEAVHDCVVAGGGVAIFTQMIEAELSADRQRVDRLVVEINEVVDGCDG